MKTRLCSLIASVLLTMGPAAAQTGDVEALKAFMTSDRYTGLLNRAFATITPDVFQRCPALVSTTSKTVIVKPVTFGPSGFPVSGSWRQRFPISGCGNDTTLNLFFDVLPDGKINTIVGVPGESHADLALQKDAFRFVAIAVRSTQKNCGGLSIKTTTFEGDDLRYPPTEAFARGATSRPWWENWVVVGCGRTWDVPVDFIPDATGTQVYQPAHIVER